MSVVVRSRRQFLVGTGGVTLALPLLTSLLPKEARAQAQASVRPRFIALASAHGAIREPNMYPRQETLTERTSMFSGHEVSSGRLALEDQGGMSALSAVMRAPSSKFTPRIASKMNVLRGFDLPWNIGHHTGGHLGNFARNDANKFPDGARPTIDQVLAWSSSFYSEEVLRSTRERSMHVGMGGRFSISWGYANPENGGQGAIEPVPTSFSSKELFDSIFVPNAPPPRMRTPIIDLVRESYNSLRTGSSTAARRLSKADRDRLGTHMDRVSELQRRVNVVANCSSVSPPSRSVDKSSGGLTHDVVLPDRTREFYETFNDVVVAAVICGTSRIATIYPHSFSEYAGDWHNNVAHRASDDDEAQALLTEENRRFFETAFLDLASKLDAAQEGEGRTYLDNSLLVWTQESGPSTHDPISLPVVTAGGAGGYFRTGHYVDYRNHNAPKWGSRAPGLLYNQWLANVLMAMGLKPAEFERDGLRGYGGQFSEDVYGDARAMWPERVAQAASRPLPIITQG